MKRRCRTKRRPIMCSASAEAKARAGWETLQFRNLPPFRCWPRTPRVTLDNKIIGKPRNREEAAAMLRLLSGQAAPGVDRGRAGLRGAPGDCA